MVKKLLFLLIRILELRSTVGEEALPSRNGIPNTKGKRSRARHLSCRSLEAVLREGEAVYDAGLFAKGEYCARMQDDCSANCGEHISSVEEPTEELDVPEPGCGGCVRIARRCGGGHDHLTRRPMCSSLDTLLERYMLTRSCPSDCQGICENGICICQNAPRYGGASCNYDNGLVFKQRALDINLAETKHSKRYAGQLEWLISGHEGRKARGSGPGSTLAATYGIRTVLPHLVSMLKIRTIADAGSGDFNWFRHLINATHTMRQVKYRGLDVVGALADTLNEKFGLGPNVRFLQFDLATMRIWPNDLIILRDVLFHFVPDRSMEVLKHIHASGSNFLLTSYFPGVSNSDFDSQLGHRRPFYRINLLEPPFNFSPPILNIGFDGRMHAESRSRVLGLWRLPVWKSRNDEDFYR